MQLPLCWISSLPTTLSGSNSPAAATLGRGTESCLAGQKCQPLQDRSLDIVRCRLARSGATLAPTFHAVPWRCRLHSDIPLGPVAVSPCTIGLVAEDLEDDLSRFHRGNCGNFNCALGRNNNSRARQVTRGNTGSDVPLGTQEHCKQAQGRPFVTATRPALDP